MTENQIKEYERLSKLKDEYKRFIENDGDVAIVKYYAPLNDFLRYIIKDKEFKDLVKDLAKERLENINKQIENL